LQIDAILLWLTLFFSGMIFLHFALGLGAMRRFPPPLPGELPGVSVIKPIKGADPETYLCLESFCRQRYPGPYEIVFSLQDPEDPALPLLERLRRNYPEVRMKITVNPVRRGMSGKTSNLFYGVKEASHPYLVFSDADMRAEPDFVHRLVSPLLTPATGLSAAVPVHTSGRGLWALLYQLQLNVTILAQWLPWAKVLPLGVSGGTLALPRSVLEEIGGVEAFGGFLLDDVKIGLLVREAGYRIELGPALEASVGEKAPVDVISLLSRGAAIYRFMLGALLTVTYLLGAYFYLPVWLVSLVTLSPSIFAIGWLHLGLKTLAFYLISRFLAGSSGREALYTVVLDGLFLFTFAKVSLTRRIHWRGMDYTVDKDGRIVPIEG